jgi:hypothetical protein
MTTAKKTKKRFRRLLIALAAVLLLILGVGGYFFEKALHLENYKVEILEALPPYPFLYLQQDKDNGKGRFGALSYRRQTDLQDCPAASA